MTIQATLSDELWEWLMEQGWRRLSYRADRRHYREMPATCVAALVHCPVEERPLLLRVAVTWTSPQ